MVDFMAQLKTGEVNGVKVKLGRMQVGWYLINFGIFDFIQIFFLLCFQSIKIHTDPEEFEKKSTLGLKSKNSQKRRGKNKKRQKKKRLSLEEIE